jgi:ribosomal-protein-alanine N-acetyltransferase
MDFVIMEMNPYHISGCAALESECFSEPWSERMLLDECNNPLAHYFVAMDKLLVCGYGGYHAVCGEGEIMRIAVAKNYRGNGLGRAILDRIIKSAREQNIGRLMLEVRESNTIARALYQSAGFRTISKRQGYYQNPAENALVMELKL